MGNIMSSVWDQLKLLYLDTFSNYIEREPVCFYRMEDFDHCGDLRVRARANWDTVVKSMTTWDLSTRRLFARIISKRLQNIHSIEKFTKVNIRNIETMFPIWDEIDIREMHDLFQVFEIDGDGVIEISEICVGLDHLGDKTPMNERLRMLTVFDTDKSGRIDFEEFLKIAYNIIVKQKAAHPLAKTFIRLTNTIQIIGCMSIAQMAQSSFI